MNLSFTRNLGVLDRVIRVVVGLILLSFAMTYITTGWIAQATIVLAVFLILEAAIAY
ncbi:YgaP-like transmembrane domain [Desulfosporosinus sp. HMP52]|uniref:YgaP-like transmembrane domain n=1 Tax=Desulfosporosinus sp. HMP52 TaxID=1487923 RepID=UPI0009DD5F19|nr:YgaP-like transmembrane domain [Desulfosporosinus sp. HMP52]